ncbi:hypothetical protein SOVF_003390 [Spinacia oleracea]|nr:hypothetical protein SOVF_003390 [Spinacia oleracea]
MSSLFPTSKEENDKGTKSSHIFAGYAPGCTIQFATFLLKL